MSKVDFNNNMDLKNRYEKSFGIGENISLGFGDYLDESLIKNKGEMIPALYYVSRGHASINFLFEVFNKRGIRGVEIKSSSRLLDSDFGNRKYPPCFSCMHYANPKDISKINALASCIALKVDEDILKKVANIKKFNFYNETRNFNDCPLALIGNFDDARKIADKLSNEFVLYSFNVYKVNRNLDGSQKDYYEIDFCIDTKIKSSLTQSPMIDFKNKHYKPILTKLLKDFSSCEDFYLVEYAGRPMEIVETPFDIFSNTGKCYANGDLTDLLKEYYENKGVSFESIRSLKDVESYPKLYNLEEPKSFDVNSSANSPILHYERKMLNSFDELNDYFDESLNFKDAYNRAMIFIVDKKPVAENMTLKHSLLNCGTIHSINSHKINVLNKVYYANMISYSRGCENEVAVRVPYVYKMWYDKGLISEDIVLRYINVYNERRDWNYLSLALIDAKVDSKDIEALKKRLDLFDNVVKCKAVGVTRNVNGKPHKMTEILYSLNNINADKKFEEYMMKLSKVSKVVFDDLESACEEMGIKIGRVSPNGQIIKEGLYNEKVRQV